ncbi:MAG: MBL fold metallo-hydrolase [Sphaerochaetaceae bacterium]
MRVTFLGTGTSYGVPRIGCSCLVCTSNESKNKRYRTSLMVREDETTVVIDTSVEFRLQMLRENVKNIDAVFYTHNHADHMNGIDDIRIFSLHKELDVYGPPEVLNDIEHRFAYAINDNQNRRGVPKLRLNSMDEKKGVTVGKLHFQAIPLIHGSKEVYGYRIGKLAYLTDCKEIPSESKKLLKGVKVVIIDAFKFSSHDTHMSVDEAVAAIRELGGEKGYITHLDHEMDYHALNNYLPDNIEPAYDQLSFEV